MPATASSPQNQTVADFSGFRLETWPSRRVIWLVTGIHVLCSIEIWRLNYTASTLLALFILVTVTSIYTGYLFGVHPGTHGARALILDNKTLFLEFRSGRHTPIIIQPESIVHPHLTLLKYRIRAPKTLSERFLSRYLVLTRDNCQPESFRRLRVVLNLKQSKR